MLCFGDTLDGTVRYADLLPNPEEGFELGFFLPRQVKKKNIGIYILRKCSRIRKITINHKPQEKTFFKKKTLKY